MNGKIYADGTINLFGCEITLFLQPTPKALVLKDQQGTVAEWLGRGLQNLVQRFESARYLSKAVSLKTAFFVYSYSHNNMALSKEEDDFLAYWEANRENKKKFLRQFSIGLPLSAVMALALFVNVFSGWNRRAEMVIRGDTSAMYTVLVAIVGIAVFMTIFASRHKWDMNEQRYQELKQKQATGDATNTAP